MTQHATGRAAVVSLVCGLAYWSLASAFIGGGEPWDAGAYWTLWYPGALVLSAALGLVFPARAWIWGLLVLLAQVPVVAFVSGIGPLMLAGLLYALLLAIPALAVSWAAGRLRLRRRRD
ncbi:MAG: hypothetical protein ABW163_06340 [Luteimonas sp.]